MAKATHLLKLKSRDKNVSDATVVGRGWENDARGISVLLNKGVTLSWRDLDDHILVVWPNDAKPDPSHPDDGTPPWEKK